MPRKSSAILNVKQQLTAVQELRAELKFAKEEQKHLNAALRGEVRQLRVHEKQVKTATSAVNKQKKVVSKLDARVKALK